MKHKYNEVKYKILLLLAGVMNDISPAEIARAVDITKQSAKEQCRGLTDMGYIWRRIERREGYRNYYSYCNLKPKGYRVLKLLRERVKIQEKTGIPISLNLRKSIYSLTAPKHKFPV